jgi:hypothetical protein
MSFKSIKIVFLSFLFFVLSPGAGNAIIWDTIYQPGDYPEGSLQDDEQHAYTYNFPLIGIVSTDEAEIFTITVRINKGMSLATSSIYKDTGPFIEMFKIELESGKGGFVKAIDIAREYKTYHSPDGTAKIISDIVGASFDEDENSYLSDWGYWLALPENQHVYLGSGRLYDDNTDIFSWDPRGEFFYTLLKDEHNKLFPSVKWPVSKVFSLSGELIWKFSEDLTYLTSPVWLSHKRLLLRGIQYDDAVYLIELESRYIIGLL